MERLPGFRDFYPEPLPQPGLWSANARQYIFNTWRSLAQRYGFHEYDGPPLEPLELFTTKSGGTLHGTQGTEPRPRGEGRPGERVI